MSGVTGYDWRRPSPATRAEERTVEAHTGVQAGQVLIVEQAVGHCDGNHAQTELFKFTNMTKEGKILETAYRWTSTIQTDVSPCL